MLRSEDSTMAADYSSSSLTCILPGDIMLDIITRQPVKALLKFKCVSKSWYSLIKSPSFIKMHYNDRSKLEDGSLLLIGHNRDSNIGVVLPGSTKWEPMGIWQRVNFDTVGLSKGLICGTPWDTLKYGMEFLVMNPALKEFITTYRKLTWKCELPVSYNFISLGFGYDHEHNDFKIVRIERLYKDSIVSSYSRVNIYSLHADSWKTLDDVVNIRLSSCSVPISSGNLLYYVSTDGSKIIVFDLSREIFHTILKPHYGGIILVQPGELDLRYSLTEPWKQGSIAVYILDHETKDFWMWILSPKNDPSSLYEFCWRRERLVSPEEHRKSNERRRKTVNLQFPEYRHLTRVWGYKESLVPVKRVGHFSILNLLNRLKDTFW